jgi:galactokinase
VATDRRTALVERLFELVPEARGQQEQVRVVRAPGRVNLIGEHTDYNLGFVLPVAIDLETWIASVPSGDGGVRLTSLQLGESVTFDVNDPGPHRDRWTDYVAGVAWALGEGGVPLRGVTGVVDTTIPLGSGLSSSAALELAAAWTLAQDVPPAMESMGLAQAAQHAENDYVGVRCGLMDQFASTFGRAGHALLLDCRSLEHRAARLPEGYALVVLDTSSPRRLDASAYNARRAQCERAAAALEVASLRDVTPPMLGRLARLVDEEAVRRCRHVVEENARVLETVKALEAGDMTKVGRLFAESHSSLRDLFEVSSPELNTLVDLASAVPGVVAARMTGAGFGGCTVNVVEKGAVDRLHEAFVREYPRRTGRHAGFYVVEAVDGAGTVA